MTYLRNIHEKKIFGPKKYPREKSLTHEIPTKKFFGPTKFWTHKGTVARWHETHETHNGTRPTEFTTLILEQRQLTQQIMTSFSNSYSCKNDSPFKSKNQP